MSVRRIMELLQELEGSASDEQISQKYRELYEIAHANIDAFRRQRGRLASDGPPPSKSIE